MSVIVWPPGLDHEHEFNKALADWISAHIWTDGRKLPSPNLCFGVFDGEKLQGAVAFHNWQPQYGVIEFSGASVDSQWLSREVIRQIAAYGFDTLGCQLLAIRVDPGNLRVIRIFSALGFETYAIPRMRGRDKAELFMTLTVETRDASRFIRRK